MPGDQSATLDEATAHHQRGELSEAEGLYQQVLASDPDHPLALGNYAALAQATDRGELAVELLKRGVTAHPELGFLHLNLGEVQRLAGDCEAAMVSFQRALAIDDTLPVAHIGLGYALRDCGRVTEAVESLRQAVVVAPERFEGHNGLGLMLLAVDRADEAVAAFSQALTLAPTRAHLRFNLANAYRAQGDLERACEGYRDVVSREPQLTEASVNLLITLRELERFDDAVAVVAALESAALVIPEVGQELLNLGNALQQAGRLGPAERCLMRYLEHAPASADGHATLANALKKQGRVPEAMAHYRTALRRDSDNPWVHANLLQSLSYQSDISAEEVFAEHCSWAERHVGAAPPLSSSGHRDHQRLRIGYLSPDFRAHSVSYFFEPLLGGHDRDRVELYAYAEVRQPDEITERLRGQFDHWRDTTDLSDELLARQIHDDQVDVLVDLAGHTGNSRLCVMGWRLAPVQISYLGYPATTGLATMDYRLVDEHTDPPGTGTATHTETLLRLPECFLCYQPSAAAPAVAPLPAQARGQVTFGSFNALPKVTDAVVGRWAQILAGVSSSRLLLKSPSFEDKATRQRYRGLFADHGIEPGRLELRGFVADEAAHLGCYGEVDIGLDPFPYNGTTTTCEALWMGVPIITLSGSHHAGRVGVSLLSQVGLGHLCASDEERYVAVAVELASNLTELATLRAGLRDRMRASPLCDATRLGPYCDELFAELVAQAAQATD